MNLCAHRVVSPSLPEPDNIVPTSDPLALFLSLSSVILAFAFVIGSASAKYFEGVLFILVRRPYGIGDFIHVSNVNNEVCWHRCA